MKFQELSRDFRLSKNEIFETSKFLGKKLFPNTNLNVKEELKIRQYLKERNEQKNILSGKIRRRVRTNTSPFNDRKPEILNKKTTKPIFQKPSRSGRNFLYQPAPKLEEKKTQKPSTTKEFDKNKEKPKKQFKEKQKPLKNKRKFQDVKRFKDKNLKNITEDYLIKFRKLRSKNQVKKEKKVHTFEARKKEITFTTAMSISDFSKLIGKKSQAIKRVLKQIDLDTEKITADIAELIAEELKVKIEVKKANLIDDLQIKEQENLKTRAPVVTIMGHVDHGKTSLLDAIRGSKLATKEAGNITQHIGAYEVKLKKGSITFLDTPGHEAFSAMRARGSNSTDIVVLVIALNDGIKPQTIEAIKHAQFAKVPIIVALTKSDKGNSGAQKIKESLMRYEIISEEFGGNTIILEVSAHSKAGLNDLLEFILLQAETMKLQASFSGAAKGVVIESRFDKKKGNIVSLLVQNGVLKIGDYIFSDKFYAKIRSMNDINGKITKEVFASQAVEVMGFADIPPAGSIFQVASEKFAKAIVEKKILDEKSTANANKDLNFENDFFPTNKKELNIIIKADTHGSLEAISELVKKVENDQMQTKIIFGAVGAVNKSDVHLAVTSQAMVIGFHVRPEKDAKELAENQKIEIAIFDIIYELLDAVKSSAEGLLAPIVSQQLKGKAEILNIFQISKIGVIAGCKVLEGKILKDSILKVIRSNNLIHEGALHSLKHLKSNVEKIQEGEECGLTIQNYKNFQVGDIIECYSQMKTQAKL